MKRFIAAGAMLALASSCLAYDVQVAGHIKAISIDKTFGSFVFVQLDTPHSVPLACQTNLGWTYTLPQQTDTDKKMFALLMLAKAMGQTVSLHGSGQCSDFGSIESALGVEIVQ